MTREETELIDISVLVSPITPEWPGDTPFSCGWTWDMAQGSSVNVSAVTMSPHVGTHADTPLHVTPGAAASETLPLATFNGNATVVDMRDVEGAITLDALLPRIGNATVTRLLLRTGRSIGGTPGSSTFPETWPALDADCAATLVSRGLILLGVDCPSVDERESKTLDVHHALLDHGACVLENLDLGAVPPGEYELRALPMRVAGLDAAPVRAVLVRSGKG